MNTIESQRARLKAVLHECSVHAERIAYARKMCAPLFPLDAAAYSKQVRTFVHARVLHDSTG